MIYLHETVDVKPEYVDEYGPKHAKIYRPAMESAGARCVALWETVALFHPWPQFIALWELDGVDAVSSLFGAQQTRKKDKGAFAAWRRELGRLATRSEGRMLSPSAGTPPLKSHKRAKLVLDTCLHEWITTVQNKADQYCKQLEAIYVPHCHLFNRAFVGTYHNVWNNKEAINLWTLPDEFTVYPSNQDLVASNPRAAGGVESWVVMSASSLREGYKSGLMRLVKAK
jgi:hypothetical protein